MRSNKQVFSQLPRFQALALSAMNMGSLALAAVTERVAPGRQRDRHFLRGPTILAWDLAALCRILPLEAKSP